MYVRHNGPWTFVEPCPLTTSYQLPSNFNPRLELEFRKNIQTSHPRLEPKTIALEVDCDCVSV